MKRASLITAALLALTGCRSTVTDGHPITARWLSHTAVETYIGQQLTAIGVSCNHGQDFPLTDDGASFTCTSEDGRTFTVTVTNAGTGDYEVRQIP